MKKYKFWADHKGIAVEYNPTYRQNYEVGLKYMKKNIRDTQTFEGFNEEVDVIVYEEIDGEYVETERVTVGKIVE